jgi:transcriptional regulator with XRE-family HTH domain
VSDAADAWDYDAGCVVVGVVSALLEATCLGSLALGQVAWRAAWLVRCEAEEALPKTWAITEGPRIWEERRGMRAVALRALVLATLGGQQESHLDHFCQDEYFEDAMNSEVIAANLLRLRGAKGLSQDRVAELAGLSRSAYRNIESGAVEPRVRNLEAIAGALGASMRELLEPVAILRNVRFRSQKKLRTRAQILSNAGRWLCDYDGLEEVLQSRRPFRLQGVAASIPAGTDRAVAAARATRAALGLRDDEPLRDICGLLDSAGVKVLPMVVASDGFFGLSVGPSDGGPAVVVNTWERISVERWIFTAAHELGHLILHLDDYDDAEAEDPEHERDADAFAAEFLMPDAVFRREWADTYGLPLVDRVIKVKRIFRVSYRTVLSRLAPAYKGWGNIWIRFQTDYKRVSGQSLAKTDEPDGVAGSAFGSAAPEALRGREPDHLSAGDFREDRLAGLVRRAVEAGEISLGRGGEILGLPLRDMRALSASWVG